MNFKTSRFGAIEFEETDVIDFAEGLLGFEGYRRFVILQHNEGSPFRWLQSIEEPGLAFLVTDPAAFLADYSPEMPAEAARALAIDEQTPRLVYTIVTIPPGKPEEMTLNLAGPIVVNAATRAARQVVLESDEYPIKHRVMDQVARRDEKLAA
jgi:flagellar assembly factor FliW